MITFDWGLRQNSPHRLRHFPHVHANFTIFCHLANFRSDALATDKLEVGPITYPEYPNCWLVQLPASSSHVVFWSEFGQMWTNFFHAVLDGRYCGNQQQFGFFKFEKFRV